MNYKKIYILAPKDTATGGVELAHQLIHILRNQGKEAYVVYEKDGNISTDQTITPAYTKYNLATTTEIEDSPDNILVLPEVYFDYVYRFDNVTIGCWWMSVDNHFNASNCLDSFKFPGTIWQKLKLFRRNIRSPHKNKLTDLSSSDRILHFYQSRYAQHFLYRNGFSNLYPLTDYINTELAEKINYAEKEDIVLYNPAKGLKFTEKIIAANPDITFMPIKGMTRAQVKEILCKAKIYIDFGNFPGKDRLPREAALNGCCVITGKNGASFFYEDLPILAQYKIESKQRNVAKISRLIKDILTNYESHAVKFNKYRDAILSEESVFKSEINYIFS